MFVYHQYPEPSMMTAIRNETIHHFLFFDDFTVTPPLYSWCPLVGREPSAARPTLGCLLLYHVFPQEVKQRARTITEMVVVRTVVSVLRDVCLCSQLPGADFSSLRHDFFGSQLPGADFSSLRHDFFGSQLPSADFSSLRHDFFGSQLPGADFSSLRHDFFGSQLLGADFSSLRHDFFGSQPSPTDISTPRDQPSLSIHILDDFLIDSG